MGRGPGEKGTRWPSPSASSCGESNNKSEVNPLPGRKLSLKLDEATAVQRESDTQTREQLLIPHRKMGMESSGPGGRPPLCLSRIENTALLRGWDFETQTPRGSCQVEGSPRLPAFTSLVRGLAVMRRRARTFNWLGQKGFLIRRMGGCGGGGAFESQHETTIIQRRPRARSMLGCVLPHPAPTPEPLGPSCLHSPAPAISLHLEGDREEVSSGPERGPDREEVVNRWLGQRLALRLLLDLWVSPWFKIN